MAYIELVIKVDEDDYERLKKYEKAPFNSLTSRVYEAIANGTILQKGHGRLIDADELIKDYGNPDIEILLENMDTIIEGDKEE